MRSYSVGRLTPSSSAVRETLPSVMASAWLDRLAFGARAHFLEIEQQRAVAALLQAQVVGREQRRPRAMITAVFTLFSSSRTLPGQRVGLERGDRLLA